MNGQNDDVDGREPIYFLERYAKRHPREVADPSRAQFMVEQLSKDRQVGLPVGTHGKIEQRLACANWLYAELAERPRRHEDLKAVADEQGCASSILWDAGGYLDLHRRKIDDDWYWSVQPFSRLAGHERDAKPLIDHVIDFLGRQIGPVRPDEIQAAMRCQRNDLMEILQALIDSGGLRRVGDGIKGSPYKYELLPASRIS